MPGFHAVARLSLSMAPETSPAPAFSVREAAESIRSLQGFDEGLRRKVEGATWIIWGLVFGGIGMTYGAAELYDQLTYLSGSTGGFAQALAPFLWLPWTVGAAAATVALWRSTETLPRVGSKHPWLVAFGGISASIAAMWILVLASWSIEDLIGFELTRFLHPLTILGAFAIVFGAWNPLKLTRIGGRVAIAVGLSQIVIGIGVALAMPREWSDVTWQLQATVNVVIATSLAATWIVGGLYETLRG